MTDPRPMSEKLTAYRVCLELPPTANNLFVNWSGGRRKAAAYQAWQKYAITYMCLAAKGRAFDKKAHLSVCIMAGIDYRRDLDNIIKPTLDTLKEAGIIHDDRYVEEITAYRSRKAEKGTVTASIMLCEEA